MSASELKGIAHDLRVDIVKSIAEAGSGHPGGSLSCADILSAFYLFLVSHPHAEKYYSHDRV